MEALSQLPACLSSLSDNQSQQLDKIRAFAVSEIARQNLLTNSSKVACERKLALLQTTLNQVCNVRPPSTVLNGPFVYGGTNCTRGWNFVDIFFSDSVKIMRFYDFARTPVS